MKPLQKQLLCACDALTKLQNLVLQERINLQKKQLEMKLAHLLVSQVRLRSKPICRFWYCQTRRDYLASLFEASD